MCISACHDGITVLFMTDKLRNIKVFQCIGLAKEIQNAMAIGDNVLCECKRKTIRKSKKDSKKFRRVAYNSHRKVSTFSDFLCVSRFALTSLYDIFFLFI